MTHRQKTQTKDGTATRALNDGKEAGQPSVFIAACMKVAEGVRITDQKCGPSLTPTELLPRYVAYAPLINLREAEFMQYRRPVGFGPSSNTWPK